MKSIAFLFLSLTPLSLQAVAQETPKPAPELQKYAPLIGHWQGSGTAKMGGPEAEASDWESHSTYSWALGDFFVQEDTVVRFEDMPEPLVMRSYLGWDGENERYVSVGVDNDGTVGLNPIEFLPDGTIVQMMYRVHMGQGYLERYSSKVTGDSMTFAIDMMSGAGPAMDGVRGSMKRVDERAPMALDASSFTAEPGEEILRLAKTAGTWDVKATMVMMPGMPKMDVIGVDVVKPLFDGTIVHVHTAGEAVGMPEKYVGELFYGYDEASKGIRAVYVSNMGEIGAMDGAFSADGKQFILTAAMRYMGQPCVSRMMMQLDANGAPTGAIGHCMLGASEPYENWNATYTRR